MSPGQTALGLKNWRSAEDLTTSEERGLRQRTHVPQLDGCLMVIHSTHQ